MELYNIDCLIGMKNIPDKSIDLILADLPYGITQCQWDSVISLDKLWEQYERIIKPNGAIILFGSQPFTSALIMSNPKMFRYDIVWDKVNRYTGYGNSKKMPLRRHESILVFYKKLPTYNPQMTDGKPYIAKRTGKKPEVYVSGGLSPVTTVNDGKRYPHSILSIKADNKKEKGLHPTQKPIAILEYLIKTYTNENQIVLDNTMGSGSTGIACLNTNRHFIGMELDKDIFQTAKDRIEQHKTNLSNH
jgi:site-specific DNA-methyltransferase (adenine-specific)